MHGLFRTITGILIFFISEMILKMIKPDSYTRILFKVSVLFILFLVPACSGAIFLKNGSEISRDEINDVIMNDLHTWRDSPFPVQFFYTTSCGSCRDAREYFMSFIRKNPSVPVEFRNLASNEENRGLLNEYKKQFSGIKISYPIVFIGDFGITGSSDIIHVTGQIVREYLLQLNS